MTPGYPSTAWARLIMGTLAQAGITDVCVSPGSRSTPFLAAALATRGLTLRSVVDERSAGFYALGLARATGRTVALLCTSGTAAANYLPAVVEGNLSRTPLLVLTADRPNELHYGASPQTIDQTCLYGAHVRRFVDLGMPASERDVLLATRRQILAAVATTQSPLPGPVHVDLRARKPLEPIEPHDEEDRALCSLVEQLVLEVAPVPPVSPPRLSSQSIDDLVDIVERQPLGLIACGYDPELPLLDSAALAAFARATGYPVLLDATHPLRMNASADLAPFVVSPHDPLLRLEAWHRAQAPHLVVQLGRPLTSRAWQRWLDDLDTKGLVVLARDGWPDPTGRGRLLGAGDLSAALRRAAARFTEQHPPRSSGWGARWLRASRVVSEVNQRLLSATDRRLGELQAVATVLSALGPRSRLVAGNSLPVREIDLLAHRTQAGVHIEGLRGASGIDGVVSFAAGLGGADDRPTALLVGDISLLHDVGGLWATRDATAPLALVVINNRGGRIFEQLPAAGVIRGEGFLYYTTPHDFDLSRAAELYGIAFARPKDIPSLHDTLIEALNHPGATLIEVQVPPDSAQRDTPAFVSSVENALALAGLLVAENSR
jgi:2-succinyl-5-enolpyruvyl-6-hydroxy-3-cyclohexene-1-carboxylate synthase